MQTANLNPTARRSRRNTPMVAAAAVLLGLAAGACQTKANTMPAVTTTTAATASTSTIAPTTTTTAKTTTKTATTTSKAPIGSLVTTTTVNLTCAQKAARRYIQTTGAGWANHEFEVLGHAAQLVCGGPDDSHFVVSTTLERLVVAPTARVTVIVIDPSNGITVKPISFSDLPAFLGAHPSNHYFEVSGAPTSVTALDEQYRP